MIPRDASHHLGILLLALALRDDLYPRSLIHAWKGEMSSETGRGVSLVIDLGGEHQQSPEDLLVRLLASRPLRVDHRLDALLCVLERIGEMRIGTRDFREQEVQDDVRSLEMPKMLIRCFRFVDGRIECGQ